MCVLFAEGDLLAPWGRRKSRAKREVAWESHDAAMEHKYLASLRGCQLLCICSTTNRCIAGTVQTLTEKHCSVLRLHIYAEALVSIALLTFQEKQLSTLSKAAKTQPRPRSQFYDVY